MRICWEDTQIPGWVGAGLGTGILLCKPGLRTPAPACLNGEVLVMGGELIHFIPGHRGLDLDSKEEQGRTWPRPGGDGEPCFSQRDPRFGPESLLPIPSLQRHASPASTGLPAGPEWG